MLEEHTVQDLWSWNGPLRARCDHYLTSPEFTAQGLLLGPRIRVLRADCTKAAATPDAPSLGSDPLDGDLPRARALLSVAYGYPISPWQMSRLQAAAAVTSQRPALAGIILAHAGLSRIPATPALAERLYHAEKLLDSAALSPIALLDALDLLPDDWAIHKNHQRVSLSSDSPDDARKYSPTQPRVSAGRPEGGQFTRQSDTAMAIPVKTQAPSPVVTPVKPSSDHCRAAPTSAAERAASESGDRASYWKSRLAAGDPLAQTALAIVQGTGLLGVTANAKLSAALFDRDPGMTFPQNAAEMRQIGVEIMRAHVANVDKYNGYVTSAMEAKSHFEIFAEHGLSARTFGGAPLTGTQTEASLTSRIWMGGC